MSHFSSLLPDCSFVQGQGTNMRALNAMVIDISKTNLAVLLVGESGTGKEVYARAIHALSNAKEAPFRKINCGALDAGHLIQEVRHYLQGGIAGQNGGTLFFDGVDELDSTCQRALVSILPDGPETMSGLPRLVSSTAVGLDKRVEVGAFRRELYFRLNGVRLCLPPLRERREDLLELVNYFLRKYVPAPTRDILNAETLNLLASQKWPGNIRELENVVKQIGAFRDSETALHALRVAPVMAVRSIDNESPISTLKVASRAASRRTERELILKALEQTRWNRKRAAENLRISYKSLLHKIEQIDVHESRSDGI